MRIVFFGLGLIGVVSAMSVHGTALIFFDALSLFFVFGSSIVFTLAHHSASEVWDAFAAATGKNNLPGGNEKGNCHLVYCPRGHLVQWLIGIPDWFCKNVGVHG